MSKIAVIGAGGWGTALTITLAHKHDNVGLWVWGEDMYGDSPLVEIMASAHINPKYLKDTNVMIPSHVKISSSLEEISGDADYVITVVPTQYMRPVLKKMKGIVKPEAYFCSASKGIEIGTFKRPTEIFMEELGISQFHTAVLSGPSHAEEVARKIPTAVVAASSNHNLAEQIQELFFNEKYFRVYQSHDVNGIEYAAALKNVIAIAAGIADGYIEKGILGDNSKAALINRGKAEMIRLGTHMGGNEATFNGLAGSGDLNVTCYSKHGRNRHVGELIAQGKSLQEILTLLEGMVPEGVATTRAVYKLQKELPFDMPITEQVYHVIFDKKNPLEAISDLMARDPKLEHD